MSADIVSARTDWAESHRRLTDSAQDPGRADTLHRQLEVVSEELRRRIGSTFTLAELAAEYWRAETWTREAVATRAPSPEWPAALAIVEGAAFHVYSRGAVDYTP